MNVYLNVYKQFISIILSISLVGTSISSYCAQYCSLAVPGDTEVSISKEILGLDGLDKLSMIDTQKVPWFQDFKDPDIELNQIITFEISNAYEKTGRRTPELTPGDNPSGEGMYWPSPKGFIATFLNHMGIKQNDTFLEVGSADARLSCFISHLFNIVTTGLEVWPAYHEYAIFQRDELVRRKYIKEGQVNLINKNFTHKDIDFSLFSIVYYYTYGTERKRELLEKMCQVKKGCRIVIYGLPEPEIEGILAVHPDFKIDKLEIVKAGKLIGEDLRIYTRIAHPDKSAETEKIKRTPLSVYSKVLEHVITKIEKILQAVEYFNSRIRTLLIRLICRVLSWKYFGFWKERTITTEKGTFVKLKRESWDALTKKGHQICEYFIEKEISADDISLPSQTKEGGASSSSPEDILLKIAENYLKDGPDKKVLDCGSRINKAVVYFSLFAYVKGVEIVEKLFDFGKEVLDELDKHIDRSRIEVVHGDYFNEDFSKFDLIYIYWPYTYFFLAEKGEQKALQLEDKLLQQMKPDAKFIFVNVGDINPKFFTRLEKLNPPSFREKRKGIAVGVYQVPQNRPGIKKAVDREIQRSQ